MKKKYINNPGILWVINTLLIVCLLTDIAIKGIAYKAHVILGLLSISPYALFLIVLGFLFIDKAIKEYRKQTATAG